ncbi:MAG: extracellular solute-binding protein [Eubacteriales bacterium]|nr:extracellular solute-binding protein [Eubacteriales bacterium]
MKKLLAFVLALVLLLSAGVAAIAETAEDDPYFGRFAETVTLKVAKDSADEPGVWTWEDNEWTREWLEKFNIKIELMWNTGTSEEYATKFSMAMLTGELPDVMMLNTKQYNELLEGGYLADITDVYDNNIYPFLKENILENQDENVLKMGFKDGRRYGIAMANYGINTRTIMIRRDYREAVGAELPTTIEEVIDLGKKFVDEGLTKYAFVLNQNVTGDGYSDMQAVANAFGSYPGIWVKDDEGKLIYSSLTEGMKKTLDVYKDLYDNGYIQSTFATEVGDNITSYVTNGEVGIMPSDYWVATWPLPLTDADNNVIEWDMIPVVASETNDDFHVQGVGSMADVSFLAISAKCANPEAVARLWNHVCAVHCDPDLEDTAHFHTVQNADGTSVQVFMRCPIYPRQFSIPNVNMWTAVAVQEAFNGNMDALRVCPHYQQQYDNVKRYQDAVAAGDKDVAKGAWGMNKLFGGEESIFYCFYKNYAAGNYIWDARTETTENYERLWGSLKQYENTFYVNYICGTEDTTFEQFVQEWNNMGGKMLTDELNAAKESPLA